MDILAIVEWATIIVSFVVLSSGLPVCIHMYKTHSTKNVPYPLFLVYLFVNLLSFKYAYYTQNFTLIFISTVSIATFVSYIAIYLAISNPKGGPLSILTGMIAVYLAHEYYLMTLPSSDVVATIGLYMRIWCTILALLPLMDIVQMLREQSSESCDVPILLATTLNSLTWYIYGILKEDVNISAPNIPALILCAIKFVLLWYFTMSSKGVVHPVKDKPPQNGFTAHDFHKEVYNIRSRKPLQN